MTFLAFFFQVEIAFAGHFLSAKFLNGVGGGRSFKITFLTVKDLLFCKKIWDI